MTFTQKTAQMDSDNYLFDKPLLMVGIVAE